MVPYVQKNLISLVSHQNWSSSFPSIIRSQLEKIMSSTSKSSGASGAVICYCGRTLLWELHGQMLIWVEGFMVQRHCKWMWLLFLGKPTNVCTGKEHKSWTFSQVGAKRDRKFPLVERVNWLQYCLIVPVILSF